MPRRGNVRLPPVSDNSFSDKCPSSCDSQLVFIIRRVGGPVRIQPPGPKPLSHMLRKVLATAAVVQRIHPEPTSADDKLASVSPPKYLWKSLAKPSKLVWI